MPKILILSCCVWELSWFPANLVLRSWFVQESFHTHTPLYRQNPSSSIWCISFDFTKNNSQSRHQTGYFVNSGDFLVCVSFWIWIITAKASSNICPVFDRELLRQLKRNAKIVSCLSKISDLMPCKMDKCESTKFTIGKDKNIKWVEHFMIPSKGGNIRSSKHRSCLRHFFCADSSS